MNNKVLLTFVLLSSITITLGCSTKINEYQDTQPEFELKQFFTGDLKGWGYVRDYSGNVIQRFSVDMNGSWDGNEGILHEVFKFSDGKIQERTWYLEDLGNGESKGTASDVIGTAYGKQNGFAFNWKYSLEVDTDMGKLNVRLNDWLYQIDEQVVASQSDIKKFGFTVGEVILFMVKQS